MMHTHSSPPQSLIDGGKEATPKEATPVRPQKCDWNSNDELQMMEYLLECKAKMTDGNMFKTPVWNGIAQFLEETRVKGGPKTHRNCSEKWTRVSQSTFHHDSMRSFVLNLDSSKTNSIQSL
jgi:hypothetical protein